MSKLTVKNVMDYCEANRQRVLNWIEKGWLKAEKDENGRWMIEEEDFNDFIRSDHYAGHPEAIRSTAPFSRVPDVEKCYPMNLILAIRGFDPEYEDELPDIWSIDIRKFKEKISRLTDREQRVIEMRYRLGMTLDECGAAIGVGRERIRQIEAKSKRKLMRSALVTGDCKLLDSDTHNALLQEIAELKSQCVILKNRLEGIEEEPVPVTPTIKLEEFDLAVRPYNCLKRYCFIDTFDDIVEFDRNQTETRNWRTIRNLGIRSLREVEEKVFALTGYQIHIKDISRRRPEDE